jgi:two-component system chemotaxis sensor kinase CheA
VNEFIEQFLIEGRELMQQATSDLLELEQNPNDRERLDSAFRAFHTLKGAAGIVDFDAMGRALHVVEDTLAAVRAGKQPVTTRLVSDCLASLDQVSAWLAAMEVSEDVPAGAAAEADRVIARFTSAPAQAMSSAAPEGGVLSRAHDLIEAQLLLIKQGGDGAAGRLMSAVRVGANVLRSVGRSADAVSLEGVDADDNEKVEAGLQLALRALAAGQASGPRTDRDEAAARAIRVDVARVDALVKLTGELTTAKNAIGHVADLARTGDDALQVANLLRDQYVILDRLVGELQRSVLNVRVLPMRQVFQRFPRLVREMSAELEKPARLITEGEDTEADKAIVEALFEPLLHVVRNAMDHGVERGALRTERGKPAVASIVVRALRAGEHVIVEVEDDGGGIDVAIVRRLAAERGVAAPEAIAQLSDEGAAELIFTPGFSTATTVSAISGRGVGMDAVRSAIQALGGQVELENRPQRGALVRFLLPFTLMMTRVMIVYAGAQAFGVPFDAVLETVRVPRGDLSAIGAARALVYRDQTVPLIDLSDALSNTEVDTRGQDASLVVADVGGELVAFEVDRIGSSVDVMLSPLDGLLAGVRGVAGATLMGDGGVLIVLDLHQFAS